MILSIMKTIKYRHLSSEERDKIAVLRATGLKPGGIGKVLGRNKSTVSRELRRNRAPIYDVYLAHNAQKRAQKRKREAARRPRLKNSAIRQYAITRIMKGWSPEQISGRICLDHPGLNISHEAIYQYIYDPQNREEIDLVPYLARSHRRRKNRGQGKKHSKSHIPNRISIDERPEHIEQRKEPGHWEADTMISRQSKAAIAVATERTSRLVKVGKLDQKSASEFRKALNRQLIQYPQHMKQTITYDNGSENVEHEFVNKVLGTQSYFCHPYHSWERGTVENTIGLIRRFLPKKTNFATIAKEQIKRIETELNDRPRKCLAFKTPSEVFKSKCCTS